MGTRTSHPPGAFSWVDLQTTDLEAAKSFYATLFGWEFEDMPAGDSIYSMARLGGEHVSAASGLPAEGIPPHWNNYVTVDAAASFFSELFGWTYDENDMGGGEVYRTIRNGGRMNGGIRRQTEMEKDIPPNWLPYFVVEDADAAAARVTELGGQILAPPFTLAHSGARIAVFADPQGAVFAVFAGETEG